ncbi:MAG: hypothetical protein PVF91_09965 [Chromatiales bacterium]
MLALGLGSSRPWSHRASLINPKFVKPYLHGDKNAYNDAASLCEAVAHPP